MDRSDFDRQREPSFYLWRRTLALRDRQAATPAFLPVAVVDATTTVGEAPIEIALADGQCVGCDSKLNPWQLINKP